MDTTARLLLQKPNPDPTTGDFLDISVLNANFDKLDAALGATPVTSGTRPTGTAAWDGRFIRETDTGRVYVRAGASWLRLLTTGSDVNASIADGEFNVTRANPTDTGYFAQVAGESVGRLLIRADGRIEMGPGTGSRDVNLYRAGTNLLKTDDDFEAVGFFRSASMRSWSAEDDTDILNFTNTGGSVGTVVLGFGFTVPPSGRVWVHISGNIGQSTNGNNTYLSYELRQGSTTLGSGTVFQGFSSNRALGAGKAVVTGGANETAATRSVYVSGLTPGSAANIRAGHWVSPAGSGNIYYRQLTVTPEF